ncbi:hypothetical protein CRE_09803 [Caenorhabditis remanei]|uniref:Sdz-33 F-box domain-containing protein n=1 Tax=Caenorhabditis remanei TaxID=31234 RepID=E3NDH1_CAERE|nr:hypothetical protein CRE_09803 [Caenorhabditis remanei]
MTMDAFVDQNVSIIDFLKTNVKSVEECNLYQRDRDINVDEHAAYLLDNLNVIDELNCFLHIKNNLITNKEWNVFFKKWIAMEINQNLRSLELDYSKLDKFRNRVLHDIPHKVVSEEVSRIVPCRYHKAQKINGGIDIRRIDGKTATFFVLRSRLEESFFMSIY